MYDILQLNEMLVPELKEVAETLELKGYKRLSKQDLIYKILDHQAVVGGDASASEEVEEKKACLLYTSPSPRDQRGSRMPSSA